MEAFQIYLDKEDMTFSQKKDLNHIRKNKASNWLFSFLKELKNANSMVSFNYFYFYFHFNLNIIYL
jgi:hypothetical protein